MIRSGEVRVNRGRSCADARVHAGDQVRIPPVRTAAPAFNQSTPAPITLPILWEDEALLAVDKPAGIAVHGGSGIAHGVIERLRASRPQARFLELVHRLDREADGLMLIAHTGKAAAALSQQFARERDGAIRKLYRIEVSGKVDEAGEISTVLDGKTALTRFHRLDYLSARDSSVVEVELVTGRKHQIRRHFAGLGHPVLGDPVYGINNKDSRGLQLKAVQLDFTCPLTRKLRSYCLL
jgi:23S rRNA pseudouridine955/2504/2580 synthase